LQAPLTVVETKGPNHGRRRLDASSDSNQEPNQSDPNRPVLNRPNNSQPDSSQPDPNQ